MAILIDDEDAAALALSCDEFDRVLGIRIAATNAALDNLDRLGMAEADEQAITELMRTAGLLAAKLRWVVRDEDRVAARALFTGEHPAHAALDSIHRTVGE
jgi:hypothetical protein